MHLDVLVAKNVIATLYLHSRGFANKRIKIEICFPHRPFEADFKTVFYTIYLVLEKHWHLLQLSRMYVFLMIHL